jgi:hypothetical protein
MTVSRSKVISWLSIFAELLLAGLALAAVFIILTNRAPNLLRPLSIAVRSAFTLVFPLAGVGLYAAMRLPGRAGRGLAWLAGLALFSLALAGLWAGGQNTSFVVSGLLPWSDAANYYADAQRLLDGQRFASIASRRPLATGLLAVWMAVSGRNLMITQALLVLMTAVACILAALEVRRTHGAAAAALALLVMFFFYRRFAGALVSEHLGLALGALGFALLWRGAGTGSPKALLGGVFLTTLALNARAGAFFVLPALLLWAGWHWRGERRFSWGWAAAAGGVVALGFLVNTLMYQRLGSPDITPFANFADSFYGVAIGGEGWDRALIDHPELAGLSERQRAGQVMAYAWEAIRQNPGGLLRGVFSQYEFFLARPGYSLYSYLSGENWLVSRLVEWVMDALCLAGLLAWLRRRTDSYGTMLVLAAAGILLSVPFAPPAHTNQVRAYAASVPFLAALPGYGLWWCLDRLKLGRLQPPAAGPGRHPGLGWYAGLLATLALAGPWVLAQAGSPPPEAAVACEAGLSGVVVQLNPAAHLNIHREEEFFLDWTPDFHRGRFAVRVHDLPNSDASGVFDRIAAPSTLELAYEPASGSGVWLVTDGNAYPPDGGLALACGRWGGDPVEQRYRFFYASQVESLDRE